MPKEYGRDQRVADFIQRELASVLQSEMRDPRVAMVSINEVRVSRDLGYADLYVSSLQAQDEAAQKDVVKALAGAAGYLRTVLAKRSTLRTTPRLRFHWDGLPGRAGELSALIDTALAADRAREQDREGDV
ncbi:MAG: 30S ribosome-binding factor RbfA [Pseudomonadales bacterium]|nr:30S ribosome-binding factor RbfA [Pseudomonadales bacterium]